MIESAATQHIQKQLYIKSALSKKLLAHRIRIHQRFFSSIPRQINSPHRINHSFYLLTFLKAVFHIPLATMNN